MTQLAIPTGLHEITPLWLTVALHSKGPSSGASVTCYSVENIGEGTAFMNQVVRMSLEYDDEPGDLPRSIVVKLPSRDPALKIVADKLGDCRREVRFYEEVVANAILQTPSIYYSAIDQVTGNTILLLEDMTGARQGDSVVGCSLTEAQLAIRQLARFQSSWWESPHLKRLDWIPLKDAETNIYQELYADAWESFVKKAGSGMPRDLQLVGERLSQDIPKIKTELANPPRTIIHGDYRLDNCFLGTPSESRSLVVFDWEFCAIGRGTYDVATFISEAFPPQQRRREEMAHLRLYQSLLAEHGVDDYSFEECLNDYRISMLEIFVFWIVGGGYCDYEGDRATVYLHNSLERISAAIADLDCAEFLSI